MSISQNTERQHGVKAKGLWFPHYGCFLLSCHLHSHTHTHMFTHQNTLT